MTIWLFWISYCKYVLLFVYVFAIDCSNEEFCTLCVCVCVCVCVCAALCNNRPTNCGLRRGLNKLIFWVKTSNSTKTENVPLLPVAQNYTVCIPTHFASTSHIGLYYIWNYTPDALMLEKEKWCIKSWGVKTFEQNGKCTFFLFCLNIIFFHLVLPFRCYRRELHVSQKTK